MSDSLPLHELQHASFPSFTISQSLLRFMSIELVMLSSHFILCHPLLILPSIFPIIRVFSSESALCIRWLKYWSCGISSVQLLSCVWLFATPWTVAWQASLFITTSWSLLKFMSIESVVPSNHLIFCHPLTSCLQSFQHQGLFKWVRSLHQMAKELKFQLQHQSLQWIFRTDFL